MAKKKKLKWEAFIGGIVDVHTHKTYQGKDMDVTGKIMDALEIGKEEFILIKREDSTVEVLVNTHWIISLRVIQSPVAYAR